MCLFFSLSPKAFRLFSFFFPRIPKCFNDVTLGGIVFGGRGWGRLFCFVQNRKTCSSILGNFLISLIISSFLFSPLFHFGTALIEMFSLTDRFSNILIFSLQFVNSLLSYSILRKISSSFAFKLCIYCSVLIYEGNILLLL